MLCPNPDCPDLHETGKPGEYRHGIELCPRCGATLLDGRERVDPEQGARDPEGVLEPVLETQDPAEVAIVESILNAEGIPCQVSSRGLQQHLGGSLSPFPLPAFASGTIVISVPADLAEAAREIINQLETEVDTDGES